MTSEAGMHVEGIASRAILTTNKEVTHDELADLVADGSRVGKRRVHRGARPACLEQRDHFGLRDHRHQREPYVDPALAEGFIEMTIPDKPTSRLQQYRLTEKGRARFRSASSDDE